MSGEKRHSLQYSERPLVAVDMFCGGALTNGLRDAGLQVTAGYDLDGSCGVAYEANNDGGTFLRADITTVKTDDLAAHYPPGATRVLVGCAPCQPYFSAAAKTKIGKSAEELQREWAPLQAFLDLILTLKPEVVSMENVVRLATKSKFPIYAEFKDSLEKAGYEVSGYRVFGPDYGIPQARRRLVLFASRLGKVTLPPATHARTAMATVGEALRDLPRLDAGDTDPHDPLHKTHTLTELKACGDFQTRRHLGELAKRPEALMSPQGVRRDLRLGLRPHGSGAARPHHDHAVLQHRDRPVRPSHPGPGAEPEGRRDPPDVPPLVPFRPARGSRLVHAARAADRQRRTARARPGDRSGHPRPSREGPDGAAAHPSRLIRTVPFRWRMP